MVGNYTAKLAFEFKPDLQSPNVFHIVRFIKAKTFLSVSSPHADHDDTNNCQRLFYDTYVAICSTKCRALERGTVMQHASHMWYDARKIRVTASTAKKVPTKVSSQNYIKNRLFNTFQGNKATRHGMESEELAIKWVESLGHIVSRRGIVVCENEPWLSASPDGVLNSQELLEIKCPLPEDNDSLENLFKKPNYDVQMKEGKLVLCENGPRGYYMQVQLGMFCTGLRTCQLLIWTKSEQHWLPVSYDEQFCVDTVARLRKFYFKDMLPYISNVVQEDRLWLSASYVRLCKE